MTLFVDYFVWHYTTGSADLVALVRNFLWFFYHLFSLPQLTGSLFAPFRRLQELRDGFGLGPIIDVIIVNTLMRAVGFLFRLVLILAGLCVLVVTLVLGFLALLGWLLMPFVIGALILISLKLLLPL